MLFFVSAIAANAQGNGNGRGSQSECGFHPRTVTRGRVRRAGACLYPILTWKAFDAVFTGDDESVTVMVNL